MKIYISGKITGLPIAEAEAKFQEHEDMLKNAGHAPINPCKILPYHPDYTWEEYMLADIKALLACDGILMLDNWQNSKGAKIELGIAQGLGLKVFYSKSHDLF